MFIIILAVGGLIFWRLDKLFNTNIINENAIIQNENGETEIFNIFNSDDKDEDDKKDDNTESGDKSNDDKKVLGAVETVESTQAVTEPDEPDIVTFVIPEGVTNEEVGNVLLESKLIKHVPTFIQLLEDLSAAEDIKPGEYNVPSNIKNLDLIETITITGVEETPKTEDNQG